MIDVADMIRRGKRTGAQPGQVFRFDNFSWHQCSVTSKSKDEGHQDRD